MKCRICNQEIGCVENLQNVPYDVNSVYAEPVKKMQRGGLTLSSDIVKNVSMGN